MNGALGERGITTWNMAEFVRRDRRATFLFLDSSELVRYELSIGVVLTCFQRLRMAYRNEIQSVVSFTSCYCFVGDSQKKKKEGFVRLRRRDARRRKRLVPGPRCSTSRPTRHPCSVSVGVRKLVVGIFDVLFTRSRWKSAQEVEKEDEEEGQEEDSLLARSRPLRVSL